MVKRVVTVTVGVVRSTVNSPEVASVPTLPAASVAVTVTSNVPSASAASVSSARLHVPSPLLVAAVVCPSTETEIVAAVSSTVPLSAGCASLVERVVMVIVGDVASIVTASALELALSFPATSVTVAVRS